MSSTPHVPLAGAPLLERAVESLRHGNRRVDIEVRGPLAEWLEDAVQGDDEGVISPYAEAVAQAMLGPQVRG
ncbi:hypothetical protein AR457_39115 [Streptomyces agglomeratus]|uniref:hypothetical protein n=1 Tax=Streptomyces agglomeratus TaxID=285458 RepID=UPI000868BCB5|nr:hypothetical protein [Streptomyces agglomeratus]OEJ21941.1 hypothetical protein AR457_39115 [Streptomyces agglomeratus]